MGFPLWDHWPTISYHASSPRNHHSLSHNLTQPPFQLIILDVMLPRFRLTRSSLFVFELMVAKLIGHLHLIKSTFSYSYTFTISYLGKNLDEVPYLCLPFLGCYMLEKDSVVLLFVQEVLFLSQFYVYFFLLMWLSSLLLCAGDLSYCYYH